MRDAVDATDFFGEDASPADPQTYDRHGRYQLDADGKGFKPYTRATTLAKTLEDTYHLGEWKARCVARGVALRDDLVARAKATPVDDKRVWKEILAEAEVVNGGGVKRNLGSAFHEFHERVPKMSAAEFAAQHPLIKATYAKYHAALQQCGIEEIFTEVTLVNTKIGSAGTADGIARLKDGRWVIIDRKSGRITDYPHSACQQLAIYANSDVMITYDENGATVRHELPPIDKHTAIVIDVTIGDENTANVAVYDLDIWSGWAAALLACSVRRWRNRRDLITPFHPDAPARSAVEQPPSAGAFHIPAPADPVSNGDPVAQHVPYGNVSETGDGVDVATEVRQQAQAIANAPDPLANTMLDINAAVADVSPAAAASVATHVTGDLGGPMTQPAHAAHPITKQAWSSAEQRNITLNPDGTRADGLTGPQVSAMLSPGVQSVVAAIGAEQARNDADALQDAYKTKAQLQAAAKRLDPAMEVARTRKNLANDMVAHPAWPSLRAALLPQAPGAGPTIVSQTDVTEETMTLSPVVTNAPGPVPPDPEPQYAGEDGYAGGEPYPAAADASVQDGYVGPPPWEVPAAAEKTPEEQILDRIAAASTTGPGSELAAVWQWASDNKITWTMRMQQAADIRHKNLAAASATTKGA